MKTSDLRRKLEDSGFDHDEVEEFVNTWAEEENDRQRDENLENLLAQGYTIDDLEKSNPYNQWMFDQPEEKS